MDGVKIVSLMSGGNIAVSGDFETRKFVKVYSLDDGKMFWNLPQLVGVSEITLGREAMFGYFFQVCQFVK